MVGARWTLLTEKVRCRYADKAKEEDQPSALEHPIAI